MAATVRCQARAQTGAAQFSLLYYHNHTVCVGHPSRSSPGVGQVGDIVRLRKVGYASVVIIGLASAGRGDGE